jgi:PhnB protein
MVLGFGPDMEASMSFTPFLFFDGNCAEAIDFYAEVLGADEVVKTAFGEAPAEAGLPAIARIMYAHVRIGDEMLMASDIVPGQPYQPQASVHISHLAKDSKDGRGKFERLAEGGEVLMEYQETFFAHGFGTCRDKFGTHWMIMIPKEET